MVADSSCSTPNMPTDDILDYSIVIMPKASFHYIEIYHLQHRKYDSQIKKQTNNSNKKLIWKEVCTHRTTPAGLPALQSPGRNLPVWPLPPSACWPRANSPALSEDTEKTQDNENSDIIFKWKLNLTEIKILLWFWNWQLTGRLGGSRGYSSSQSNHIKA